jgi:DNA-binding response OmpR family regulator
MSEVEMVLRLEGYRVGNSRPVRAMTVILVVENDPDVCDLVTDVMEAELHAAVTSAGTGNLALKAMETTAFDLAVIDVNMPEISGYDLARRAANRNIPTLLTSGHPDGDAKLRGCECPYLAKPFRIEQLIRESENAIVHATENIRRIKASLARLQATMDGLNADFAESNRLISESRAILAGRLSLEPVLPPAVVGQWLIRLGSRQKRG